MRKFLIPVLLICCSFMLAMPVGAWRVVDAGASATVQTSPLVSSVAVGNKFTVDVTVANVQNLAVWECEVFYNSSILSCVGAVQGPFLQSGGSSQFFVYRIYSSYNATHGLILLGACLLGPVPGATGSGTLATITFKAVGAGNTLLHFGSDPIWCFLQDASPPPRHNIPYATVDGTVSAS